MPFLMAGYNRRAVRTGIIAFTASLHRNKDGWQPAELIRFKCGDLAWRGRRFIAWGEQCYLRSLIHVPGLWLHSLPQSPIA